MMFKETTRQLTLLLLTVTVLFALPTAVSLGQPNTEENGGTRHVGRLVSEHLVEVAEDYLASHPRFQQAAGLLEARVSSVTDTPFANFVYFKVFIQGMRVQHSFLSVTVSKTGEVLHLETNLLNLGEIELNPSISALDALSRFVDVAKIQGSLISEPILTYYVDDAGRPRLAWYVLLSNQNDLSDDFIYVDATNGNILASQTTQINTKSDKCETSSSLLAPSTPPTLKRSTEQICQGINTFEVTNAASNATTVQLCRNGVVEDGAFVNPPTQAIFCIQGPENAFGATHVITARSCNSLGCGPASNKIWISYGNGLCE